MQAQVFLSSSDAAAERFHPPAWSKENYFLDQQSAKARE